MSESMYGQSVLIGTVVIALMVGAGIIYQQMDYMLN